MTKRRKGEPDQFQWIAVDARPVDLRGVYLDSREAARVRPAEAAVLATSGAPALFVADAGGMALLFPEIGHPTLCSRAGST